MIDQPIHESNLGNILLIYPHENREIRAQTCARHCPRWHWIQNSHRGSNSQALDHRAWTDLGGHQHLHHTISPSALKKTKSKLSSGRTNAMPHFSIGITFHKARRLASVWRRKEKWDKEPLRTLSHEETRRRSLWLENRRLVIPSDGGFESSRDGAGCGTEVIR